MSSKNTVKCRLCLVETETSRTYNLFKNNNGVPFKMEPNQNDEFVNLKLYQKVEFCCGVKLSNRKSMPSRICCKCFNTIHMWFNFRQMCYNSQVFLITQTQEVVDVDQELGDLQTVRANINNKPLEIDDCIETVGSDDEDFQSSGEGGGHFLDGNDCDDYEENVNKEDCNNKETGKQDMEDEKIKLENMAQYIKDKCGLLESFTPEDFDEIDSYINAENDEELEEFINHCATKNIAIRQLNAKAMLIFKPKVKRQSKEERCQLKAAKLPKPSTYMCNICGNVYSKKPLFQHHMRMHSDVKPFECEICNKSYRIMSDLRNHMYRHTGEKPFKCKYCDRHFMDRSSRHRHERIHTNSRPYKCTICTKSFSYSAILKNHLKLHSGEKDYVCSICNKSFTLAHQLKAHMLTISHKQKEAAYEASGYKILYETAADM